MRGNNSEYKLRNIDFIEQYRQRAGVKELHNGVLYRELTKGRGERPQPKSIVTVRYCGTLINGKVFDATGKGQSRTFKLNELILGWRTALSKMSVGSRWEVVIPFNMAYGSQGAGTIKPFSTLIFDITLLRID